MKIELITKEQYNTIKQLQGKHNILTLQNTGYESIDKSKFTEEEKKAFEEVESILRNHITGFSSFQNFRLSKSDELELRFQYNYGAEDKTMHFVGVGYILLDELKNGFNN